MKLPPIEVQEYGLAIEVDWDAESLFQPFESLARYRDQCMDEMLRFTVHQLGHERLGPPDPACWWCAWQFKFYRFWNELRRWQETCDGCGEVMYECGYSCALWEDY